MALYLDLLITDDDLVLDPAGVPLTVYGRDSIAQDIVHMIRDSGILLEMIAERSKPLRKRKMNEITLMVDADTRIVPGTSQMQELKAGEMLLTATTVDYGLISLQINAG